MIHEMKVSSVPFRKIAVHTKVIESRLLDEKRQCINIGDTILFREVGNEACSMTVKVVELLRYKTFAELFAAHDPALFGGESPEALLAEIRRFYSLEDEEKNGVVGVRFIHESTAH